MINKHKITSKLRELDLHLWLSLVLVRMSEIEQPDVNWDDFYYKAAMDENFRSDISKEQLEKIFFN